MRRLSIALVVLVVLVMASCATLGEGGGGNDNLPNAQAGPFRKLTSAEIGSLRTAPNALDDKADELTRDPSVIDKDGAPETLDVLGYFSATVPPMGVDPDPAAPPNAIVRYTALDGRTFALDCQVVLEPEAPWEGGTVGAPSALLVGAEVWLYYAGAGGIGRATSADGLTFTRDPAAVLPPDPGGWEGAAAPQSPGVVRLWDGSFRMFYEIAGAPGASSLGEARSADGIPWTRVGAGPVLTPSPATSAPDAGDEPYDSLSVGSPFPVIATSGQGEQILYVYFGAKDRLGHGVIGLCARFGADGPLERAVSPVFGSGESRAPREPSVLVYPDYSLLFATQRAGASAGLNRPAVAVGVAPAKAKLPAANPR